MRRLMLVALFCPETALRRTCRQMEGRHSTAPGLIARTERRISCSSARWESRFGPKTPIMRGSSARTPTVMGGSTERNSVLTRLDSSRYSTEAATARSILMTSIATRT